MCGQKGWRDHTHTPTLTNDDAWSGTRRHARDDAEPHMTRDPRSTHDFRWSVGGERAAGDPRAGSEWFCQPSPTRHMHDVVRSRHGDRMRADTVAQPRTTSTRRGDTNWLLAGCSTAARRMLADLTSHETPPPNLRGRAAMTRGDTQNSSGTVMEGEAVAVAYRQPRRCSAPCPSVQKAAQRRSVSCDKIAGGTSSYFVDRNRRTIEAAGISSPPVIFG